MCLAPKRYDIDTFSGLFYNKIVTRTKMIKDILQIQSGLSITLGKKGEKMANVFQYKKKQKKLFDGNSLIFFDSLWNASKLTDD